MGWTYERNIKGPTGDTGPAGAKGATGDAGPAGANGSDGAETFPVMTWEYNDNLTSALPSSGEFKFQINNLAFEPDPKTLEMVDFISLHNESENGADNYEEFLDEVATVANTAFVMVKKSGTGPDRIAIQLTGGGTSNTDSQAWACSILSPSGANFPTIGAVYVIMFLPRG